MSKSGKLAIKKAASSAIEDLPLGKKDVATVMSILEGKTILQDFFQSIKVQF